MVELAPVYMRADVGRDRLGSKSPLRQRSGKELELATGSLETGSAGTRLHQDKAIWVIKGNNVLVENIEFFNARSSDDNGAGIRAQGARLARLSLAR